MVNYPDDDPRPAGPEAADPAVDDEDEGEDEGADADEPRYLHF